MPPNDFPPERQRYSEYRFCPRCGHPFATSDFRPVECLFTCSACGFDFYQNPSPASVVAIPHPSDDGALLMLRRRTPPREGLWCVPGGFIKYGEDPVAAAARESREETGLEVRIERVLRSGLVDYRYQGRQVCVVEIAFLGRLTMPVPDKPTFTDEAAEIVFQPVEQVLADPAMLAFPEQLEVVRSYARLLEVPTTMRSPRA